MTNILNSIDHSDAEVEVITSSCLPDMSMEVPSMPIIHKRNESTEQVDENTVADKIRDLTEQYRNACNLYAQTLNKLNELVTMLSESGLIKKKDLSSLPLELQPGMVVVTENKPAQNTQNTREIREVKEVMVKNTTKRTSKKREFTSAELMISALMAAPEYSMDKSELTKKLSESVVNPYPTYTALMNCTPPIITITGKGKDARVTLTPVGVAKYTPPELATEVAPELVNADPALNVPNPQN